MEEQIINPLTYKATLKIIDVTLYENLNKENKRLRIHGREGIDETTIINEKRKPKLKEQFRSLLSR